MAEVSILLAQHTNIMIKMLNDQWIMNICAKDPVDGNSGMLLGTLKKVRKSNQMDTYAHSQTNTLCVIIKCKL